MANRSRVITMSPLVLNHEDDLDLDLWEVVNLSDVEYSDDSFSVDSLSDDDVISLDDVSFISPLPQILHVTDDGELPADLDLDSAGDGAAADDDDDVVSDQVDDKDKDLRWAQRRMVLLRRGSSTYSFGITLGDHAYRGVCYDDGGDDDHDGEYDDSYDLDEELVPRSVCKKLGRQRMRKLGKRAIAKVLTSTKTSPYAHLKPPGCIRGKHGGLGLKLKY
ncbi:hypothetical protein N665_0065s0050 [Sinapis alba]|nr:hypothetical protein N665_0065s0050 [Sinapis alba]